MKQLIFVTEYKSRFSLWLKVFFLFLLFSLFCFLLSALCFGLSPHLSPSVCTLSACDLVSSLAAGGATRLSSTIHYSNLAASSNPCHILSVVAVLLSTDHLGSFESIWWYYLCSIFYLSFSLTVIFSSTPLIAFK